MHNGFILETRDGSDDVLKQYAWGLTYIDELIQTSINDDSTDAGEDDTETDYFALQNAIFNVMMLVDDTSGGGDTTERYEYTPYGERTVYDSPGTNAPLAMAPTIAEKRIKDSRPLFFAQRI